MTRKPRRPGEGKPGPDIDEDRLALYLAAIGCRCEHVEVNAVEVEGVILADVHHDDGCPALRKTRAKDQ